MHELKPCLNCGCEVEVRQESGSYWLRCPNCGYAPIVGFTAMYALRQYWAIITEWYEEHPELLRERERQKQC